ncbi:putative E3 ubiquitin-protein ligase LIN-1 isoform X1 [Rhododendron vialii]|uniref:putative E3 ubiquitin-protein ligase LIN-1 isoform X1 n=1 Tax=Rhododendron vialii TaxID=182163 RepID=UPI00265E572A|nr:putative E3 ubiquitin-protein ligase LIN-1 isoform X1 [Rhododendron vialii]
MASLQELLSEEGFEKGKFLKNQRRVRFRDRNKRPENEFITLPIYICHDKRSFDSSKHKALERILPNGHSVISSNRRSSSDSKSVGSRKDEPAIDEVAIRAIVSILSGYIGRYLKDETFRESIKRKCYSCLERRNNEDLDDGIFANMELGIESTEILVENPRSKSALMTKSLRNSIRLLSSVSGSTRGKPNSHFSACAQLYLSIVYKLEKNDEVSSSHLLQVFCDSPFIARTHLLLELWEHFFLPHLLHIKIWYNKEQEFLSNFEYFDKEKKMKDLSKAYNDQMDMGTTQFALYYMEWLKVGAQAPPVPTVPLPSGTSYGFSRRRSLDSFTSRSSVNKSLYRTVFGSTRVERRSMELDNRSRGSINPWDLEEADKKACTHEDNVKQHCHPKDRTMSHRRLSRQNCRNTKSELWPQTHKSDSFRCFTCKNEPTQCLVHDNRMGINDLIMTGKTHVPPSDLKRAITTICSSESLADCEMAIRVITQTWLDSHGDPSIEKTLSNAQVMEGMLQVLFISNDDEVLELTISMLAEFIMRNDANRHIILDSDPQLVIVMRLLRSSSLFLKAAILLYLVKPKAKQMTSIEWIPLVLRVLEFGDQLQTLLAVQCSPQEAAYYFLNQLVTGFGEDKNFENARQVVSIGGLSALVKRMESGHVSEKTKAASIIFCCIHADGSCRHYLATNLNTGPILELLASGKERNSQSLAFALLTELLCLNRRTQAIRFLHGLQSGWGSLNTMHILFVNLQKARVEERPLLAAVLLQLDLLGDPLKCSVYRQEAVEAITAALDCQVCSELVQEQSARALLMLGGHFSYTGEATTEKWLLKEAGFDENSDDSFQGKDIIVAELMNSNEEDEEMQNWHRKAAIVLLTSGKKRFLSALSDSIANGIPCLARASLVTLSWICSNLHSVSDENLQLEACSTIVPCLIESLNHDRAPEERVLASFTLLALIKSSGCFSEISFADKGLMDHLWNLSQLTWTAKELISIITSSSRHQFLEFGNLPNETQIHQ